MNSNKFSRQVSGFHVKLLIIAACFAINVLPLHSAGREQGSPGRTTSGRWRSRSYNSQETPSYYPANTQTSGPVQSYDYGKHNSGDLKRSKPGFLKRFVTKVKEGMSHKKQRPKQQVIHRAEPRAPAQSSSYPRNDPIHYETSRASEPLAYKNRARSANAHSRPEYRSNSDDIDTAWGAQTMPESHDFDDFDNLHEREPVRPYPTRKVKFQTAHVNFPPKPMRVKFRERPKGRVESSPPANPQWGRKVYEERRRQPKHAKRVELKLKPMPQRENSFKGSGPDVDRMVHGRGSRLVREDDGEVFSADAQIHRGVSKAGGNIDEGVSRLDTQVHGVSSGVIEDSEEASEIGPQVDEDVFEDDTEVYGDVFNADFQDNREVFNVDTEPNEEKSKVKASVGGELSNFYTEVDGDKRSSLNTEDSGQVSSVDLEVNNEASRVDTKTEGQVSEIGAKVDEHAPSVSTKDSIKASSGQTEVKGELSNIDTEFDEDITSADIQDDRKLFAVDTQPNEETSKVKANLGEKLSNLDTKVDGHVSSVDTNLSKDAPSIDSDLDAEIPSSISAAKVTDQHSKELATDHSIAPQSLESGSTLLPRLMHGVSNTERDEQPLETVSLKDITKDDKVVNVSLESQKDEQEDNDETKQVVNSEESDNEGPKADISRGFGRDVDDETGGSLLEVAGADSSEKQANREDDDMIDRKTEVPLSTEEKISVQTMKPYVGVTKSESAIDTDFERPDKDSAPMESKMQMSSSADSDSSEHQSTKKKRKFGFYVRKPIYWKWKKPESDVSSQGEETSEKDMEELDGYMTRTVKY